MRWIQGSAEAGLHRVSWDLRGPAPDPVDLREAGFLAPWVSPPQGPLAAPGRYSAELFLVSAAGVRRLGVAQSFEVTPVPNALPGTDYAAVAAFQQLVAELMRKIGGVAAEAADGAAADADASPSPECAPRGLP